MLPAQNMMGCAMRANTAPCTNTQSTRRGNALHTTPGTHLAGRLRSGELLVEVQARFGRHVFKALLHGSLGGRGRGFDVNLKGNGRGEGSHGVEFASETGRKCAGR